VTGRSLINSALQCVNAIRPGQSPTHVMFVDGLELLNLLLDSWSAEELMPYDIMQYESSLYRGMPNYAINSGDTFDTDSICMNQVPSDGGSQDLTLNGTYVEGNVATMDVPRPVIITSTGDDSGRTFTVTGTNTYGDTISETITGPNASTARGVRHFKTITSVAIDDDSAGIITVGSDHIINVRRPMMILDAFVRDDDGLDYPVFPIDRERYIGIRDKDEAGMPTKFYYDRTYPSGELFVHPVPTTGGKSLSASVGTDEYITNGGIADDTAWTLESQWSATGGKLVRTPGTGDPILSGDELVTNGGFTGNADGWAAGNWNYNNNQMNYYSNSTNWQPLTQVLGAGLDSDDEIYINFAIVDHSPFGGTLFQGSSAVRVTLGSNSSESYTAAASSIAVTLAYGNGSLSIEAKGGGGTDYCKCGADGANGGSISAQKIIGYSEVGADTASQVSGDLAIEFTEGNTYRLTFTVSDYVAGSCTPSIGGTDGDAISTNGSYSMDIICGSGTDFILTASSDFEGSFDNISIVEVVDTISYTAGGYNIFLDMWMPFVSIAAANIDTDINLPGEYLLAMKWNLAAELFPEYGRNVSNFVFSRAAFYLNILRHINTRAPKPTYLWPATPVAERQLAVNMN